MTQAATIGRIGDEGFDVEAAQKMWQVQPKSMIVIEYHGKGDAFFGGQGDDRVLLDNGQIEPRNGRTGGETARFATLGEAHAAALKIPNRRAGSILGVAPSWR